MFIRLSSCSLFLYFLTANNIARLSYQRRAVEKNKSFFRAASPIRRAFFFVAKTYYRFSRADGFRAKKRSVNSFSTNSSKVYIAATQAQDCIASVSGDSKTSKATGNEIKSPLYKKSLTSRRGREGNGIFNPCFSISFRAGQPSACLAAEESDASGIFWNFRQRLKR